MRDATGPAMEDYKVFGLQVRSELALPELLPAQPLGEPDVTISTGRVPARAENQPGLQVHDGGLVLIVPDVARYRIDQGRTITVEAAPGVPERNVRLYLLGSAFGAMLHQRGLLPLHANAVEIDGKAVAFLGPSGEGKSTLAAWFNDHGCRVIADDVCVIRIAENGRAFALPGMTRLRLWQDVLEATGRRPADYERSYADDESWNKFDVPLDRPAGANDAIELSVLYVLDRSEDLVIRRLGGLDAAEAVFANTYRGSFVAAVKGELSHWQTSVRLVRHTPVYQYSRPRGLARMDEDCGRVLDHARNVEVERL